MPGMLRWALGLGAVTSVGLIGALLSHRWRSGLPEALASVASARGPGARVQAAIVLQLADCSGNLRLVHLLHLPSVETHLALAVIWYQGPASDSSEIRARLPAWTRASPLRPVPPGVVRDLARLGHRTTPVLLAADHDGRIRLVSQSPRTAREVAGLRRIVEGLTYREDL